MLQKTIKAIMNSWMEEVKKLTSKYFEQLENGDLHGMEESLWQRTTEWYENLASALIIKAAESKKVGERVKYLASKRGLKSIRKTKVSLQLKTGKKIEILSYYALKSNEQRKRKSKRRGPNGKGKHLILDYWGAIDKGSPSYYSNVSMLSVICPSYEVALEVLRNQGVKAEYKRVRSLSTRVGNKCFNQRTTIARESDESVAGKRVIISIDGGKTRTREVSDDKLPSKKAKGKREKFSTPWREPKMFVIHTLGADGKIVKRDRPIYDAMIDKPDKFFSLLFCYLKQLEIEKANEVIFISDGATWIWNRANDLFKNLKVDPSKVTFAVDYYHALQHIHSILRVFNPKQLSEEEKQHYLKMFKEDLYHGRIGSLVEKAITLAQGRKRVLDEVKYFQNHINRMNYSLLREKNLPCGSGIIESAIRRIINLRFKSPSSFWNRRNVEKLIFLRSVFLSKRWSIMIDNLTKKWQIPDFAKLGL